MKTLVDTCIWSLSLRRKRVMPSPSLDVLIALLQQNRAVMLGAVRQELLSGVRDSDQFQRLKTGLRAFPDIVLTTEDYEVAASMDNLCRSHGVQGSGVDYLICAVASRRKMAILTSDPDFTRYAKWLPIRLAKI
jgi:predicted nucleic acid-binding protein